MAPIPPSVVDTPDEAASLVARGEGLLRELLFAGPIGLPRLGPSPLAPGSSDETADQIFARLDSSAPSGRRGHGVNSDLCQRSRQQGGPSFDRFNQNIDALSADADEDLIGQVRRRFAFWGSDGYPKDAAADFQYAKINHGYWELMVGARRMNNGEEAFRTRNNIYWSERFVDSSFSHFLFTCADRYFDRLHGDAAREASFGIAFDAGARPAAETFQAPLPGFIRGGMIGALAFFDAHLGPAGSSGAALVAEGSIPKLMVLDGTVARFVQAATHGADAVLYLAPAHLSRIALVDRSRSLAEHRIVLPSHSVHERWLPVAAMAAAALEQMFVEYRSVTVFVQAAAMSFPLMVIARLLRDRLAPDVGLRFFDFGQALDIATVGTGESAGSWLRKGVFERPIERANPFMLLPAS